MLFETTRTFDFGHFLTIAYGFSVNFVHRLSDKRLFNVWLSTERLSVATTCF